MKTTNIFVVILFSILLVGCKSNPADDNKVTSSNNTDNTGIIGNWLWKSTSGGIGGTTTTPTGNNIYILRMTADSNFIECRNDTTTFSDRFTSYQVNNSRMWRVIDFLNSRRFSLLLKYVSADSLIISDTYADGYTYVYSRITQ